jgi:hypothetical protein
MNGNDGIEVAARDHRRRSWPAKGLMALGAWLVVSPLVLGTAQVTAGAVSAVTGGLALIVLAGWAWVARNRVPPMLVALSFAVWLVLAPSLWEFADGTGRLAAGPDPPSEVTEPTRAMVARADWNSILARLLILLLAGSGLLAGRRRQGRSVPTAGGEHWRHVEAGGEQR